MTKTAPPLRRNVFARTSMARVPYTVRPSKPFPRWLRRLLLLLLALLLLLLALVSCRENKKPASLATSTLSGPRLATGPICLEEAVDVSSSMTQYVPQREQAERELFAFARRVLEPADLLSEAFFAGSSELALPPTSMASLGSPPPFSGQLDDGTNLEPAVDALVAKRAFEPAACAARALVVITDGLIGDDVQQLSATLAKANYTRMYAVVPAGTTGGNRGNLRGELLDSITVYGFHDTGGLSGRAASVIGDTKPLDVVYGEILSGLTGQRLVRAQQSPSPSPVR